MYSFLSFLCYYPFPQRFVFEPIDINQAANDTFFKKASIYPFDHHECISMKSCKILLERQDEALENKRIVLFSYLQEKNFSEEN